jgi:hypothetical protein
MPIRPRKGSAVVLEMGVSQMIKHDLLTGLFIGVILGLTFTAQLAPYLAVLVILAVVFGGRMINLK